MGMKIYVIYPYVFDDIEVRPNCVYYSLNSAVILQSIVAPNKKCQLKQIAHLSDSTISNNVSDESNLTASILFPQMHSMVERDDGISSRS